MSDSASRQISDWMGSRLCGRISKTRFDLGGRLGGTDWHRRQLRTGRWVRDGRTSSGRQPASRQPGLIRSRRKSVVRAPDRRGDRQRTPTSCSRRLRAGQAERQGRRPLPTTKTPNPATVTSRHLLDVPNALSVLSWLSGSAPSGSSTTALTGRVTPRPTFVRPRPRRASRSAWSPSGRMATCWAPLRSRPGRSRRTDI